MKTDRETGRVGRGGRSEWPPGLWRGFLANERGVISIEFVMWMPAFAGMLALIADFSFIFMTNASMWDTARDAARRVALGKFTVGQAQEYVLESLFSTGDNFTVTASEDADEVVVLVRTPINDASIFGIYSKVLTGDLVARVIMLREPQ